MNNKLLKEMVKTQSDFILKFLSDDRICSNIRDEYVKRYGSLKVDYCIKQLDN